MPVFETADLTAASYSVAIFGLAATTLLLLMGTAWVGHRWKLPVALCAIAALVGVAAAWEGRAAWGTSGSVPVVYHYVGWIVSMPLQVMALYFFAAVMRPLGAGLFWRLIVVAILMVFVRYLGEAQFMNATLAFLIGLVFWLYILGELYFGEMDDAVREGGSDRVSSSYFWLRLIVTVGWAIYPLGNFLTSFAGVDDFGALTVAYNLADVLNRMAFGVAVLAAGSLAIETAAPRSSTPRKTPIRTADIEGARS